MTDAEIAKMYDEKRKGRCPSESGAIVDEIAAETGLPRDRVKDAVLDHMTELGG